MGTPYKVINNLFIDKIDDDMFFRMEEDTALKIIDGYRKSATVKFKQCKKLLNKDDVAREYPDLTDEEIEIIASLMVIEWLRPKANSTELLEPVLTTKDYTQFSNANQLTSIRGLLKYSMIDADRLIVSYTYSEHNLESLGDE